MGVKAASLAYFPKIKVGLFICGREDAGTRFRCVTPDIQIKIWHIKYKIYNFGNIFLYRQLHY
jgi:hypothetical protein